LVDSSTQTYLSLADHDKGLCASHDSPVWRLQVAALEARVANNSISTPSQPLPEPFALVDQVFRGSPAEEAGLLVRHASAL
jgi:hypothetical protein